MSSIADAHSVVIVVVVVLSLLSSHCCICRDLIFISVAIFVPVFVFVVVAVANVLACCRPHGNREAGRAGAAAVRNAAGLLLVLGIVVAVPAFALVFVLVAITVANAFACHPPCGNSKAGKAGRWPRATPPAFSWLRRLLLRRRPSPWRCGCRRRFVQRWHYWRWRF